MSKAFPTDKDNVIDDMDDYYGLNITDEEYDKIRRLSTAQLLLVTMLLSRAVKAERAKDDE